MLSNSKLFGAWREPDEARFLSCTWTFFVLVICKLYVTVRWLGARLY